MDWFGAPDYWLARWLFQRGLALVYLVAFLVAANQFRPLLGERGLLPVHQFTAQVPFWRAPSLFQWRYSDRLLALVAWGGAMLSLAALLGLPDHAPIWVSMLVWALLWAAYLSIVNVGQVFYGFGWETLLVEAGFLAIFLGPGWIEPPLLVVPVLLRWLLFRVEFGAGMIKLRGDPCWRDLTCLRYHHETQPQPGPLSWRFHHLPAPLHRVEVAANHLAQLVAPFGLLLPQPGASVAGGIIVATQAWLIASGNFSWLNVLTIVIGVAAFDDAVLTTLLGPVLPDAPTSLAPTPLWFQAIVLTVATALVVLSWRPARNLVARRQLMNASFDPLRLVNTYGAFGSITRTRDELVVEGTVDDPDDPAARWLAYEFKGKPGDPARRPPQVAPYHLRLDWLMWFAALSGVHRHPWLVALVRRLLDGDVAIRRLLRDDPFAGRAPRAVRVLRYRYRFTTPAERRSTGDWWARSLQGIELQPMVLDADGQPRAS